jgi:L-rhamnonate dehydratase
MKIADVRVVEVTGRARYTGLHHAESIGSPLHAFAEGRARRAPRGLPPVDPGPREAPLRQLFLEIESDDGHVGRCGPLAPAPDELAFLLLRRHAPDLRGRDPRAIAEIEAWLLASFAHGRTGLGAIARSAIDLALWDLRGIAEGQPVWRLLGAADHGPLPAYAALKGVSQHPAALAAVAREQVARGFRLLKVYCNHGPWDGDAGLEHNENLARTLRDAVGPEVGLAFDCWQSWDVPFTRKMLRRIERFGPAWLEEPLPDREFAAYAALRRETRVPLALGEHLYCAEEFAAALDAGAADFLQPDVCWAGGLTAAARLVSLAAARHVPLLFHTHALKPTVAAVALGRPAICPWIEWPAIPEQYPNEHFLASPTSLQGGAVALPTTPGLDMELDPARIETQCRWKP